jgi:hypothetical protein
MFYYPSNSWLLHQLYNQVIFLCSLKCFVELLIILGWIYLQKQSQFLSSTARHNLTTCYVHGGRDAVYSTYHMSGYHLNCELATWMTPHITRHNYQYRMRWYTANACERNSLSEIGRTAPRRQYASGCSWLKQMKTWRVQNSKPSLIRISEAKGSLKTKT